MKTKIKIENEFKAAKDKYDKEMVNLKQGCRHKNAKWVKDYSEMRKYYECPDCGKVLL